jgi:hypothetical protein
LPIINAKSVGKGVDKELDTLLRKAIEEKRLLRFTYKRQERVAEPHDYGVQKGITRLFCYQSFPNSALPDDLKDGNPLGIWRMLDGQMSRDPVARST